MCICMGTKTISIMDDVYRLLLMNKRNSESFSEVIRRNLKKKRDIMEFAGALRISDEEAERIKENIRKFDMKETKKLLKRYGGK